DGQMARVGPDRAHPADAARPRDCRQVEQVVARAAEHLPGIGQDTGGDDIDQHLASADDRIGTGLDRERRTEGLEDDSLHGDSPSPPTLGGAFVAIQAWYYPRTAQSTHGDPQWRTAAAASSAISCAPVAPG